MINLPASEVRKNFSDALNKVAYQRERIVLNRNGKDVAVLISLEDLELLEQLEDQLDNKSCDEALKESSETISYTQARKELGLIEIRN